MTAEDRERTRRMRLASAPLADPAESFGVLRRVRNDADALPAGFLPGGAVGTIDRDGARLVQSGTSGDAYAIPTDREVCIAATYRRGRSQGATDTCVPTETASQYGAYVLIQCSSMQDHPQRRYIAGIAPDGVRSVVLRRAGSVVSTAAVTGNGFSIEIDEPIDEISLDGGPGRSRGLPPVSC